MSVGLHFSGPAALLLVKPAMPWANRTAPTFQKATGLNPGATERLNVCNESLSRSRLCFVNTGLFCISGASSSEEKEGGHRCRAADINK